MPRSDPAKLKKVSVNLPFGLGGAEWESDPTERRAAWALYVHLVTRIAVQELVSEQGLLREALSSLHELFPVTREILCTAGPDVGGHFPSVGAIAIAVLNKGIRPFLTKWHPALQDWENLRPNDRGALEHENRWPDAANLRADLAELRSGLERYAVALGRIAGSTE
jgi:hypothetical protein